MYSHSKIYRKSHFFFLLEKPAFIQLPGGLTIARLLLSKPADSVRDLVTQMKSLFLVSIDLISDGAHLIQECEKPANHLRNTRYQLHPTLNSFLRKRRDIRRCKTEQIPSLSARLFFIQRKTVSYAFQSLSTSRPAGFISSVGRCHGVARNTQIKAHSEFKSNPKDLVSHVQLWPHQGQRSIMCRILWPQTQTWGFTG